MPKDGCNGFDWVVWPDSAPKDWKQRLKNTLLPICISPLHDKDVKTDGTPDKPHYHVMLVYYSGNSTLNNAQRIAHETCNTPANMVSYTRNREGMYKYMLHDTDQARKDHKFPYYQFPDIYKREPLNDFDPLKLHVVTKDEVHEGLKQIRLIINQVNITEYADLMDYLDASEDCESLRDIADYNTINLNTYLCSRRNKQ